MKLKFQVISLTKLVKIWNANIFVTKCRGENSSEETITSRMWKVGGGMGEMENLLMVEGQLSYNCKAAKCDRLNRMKHEVATLGNMVSGAIFECVRAV